MATKKIAGSARERLLAAANELFYGEGVHTVGIDRVIERAGVAKASLYSAFGSKDELVRAYLESRLEARKERIARQIAAIERPRDRILAIYEGLAERAAEPDFRGCAFMNATAEGPRDDSPAAQVTRKSRAWMRALFVELARDAGAADAEQLGRRLAILYDGAIVMSAMERDPRAALEARDVAGELVDAATRKPRRGR